MEFTEDETLKEYANKHVHCLRKTLLRDKDEWTCFSCGNKVMKGKIELTKIQRNENFVSWAKYADKRDFMCLHMFNKKIEGEDFNEFFVVLSFLKENKLNNESEVVENKKKHERRIWTNLFF